MVRIFFIILLCWFTVPAVAQQNTVESTLQANSSVTNETEIAERKSAKQWLNHLSELVTKTNFEARFVVYRADQKEAEPYLWRHAINDDGPDMEQLNLQNGPGKEYIRVGNKVSIFEPDSLPYSIIGDSINGPIPWSLLQNKDELYNAYYFRLIGRARISGKPAKQINIVSLDSTRYSYQLWLDEGSGMLLKMNMLDARKVIIKQIQMLGFTVTSQPHSYFSRVNIDKLPSVVSMPAANIAQQNWRVSYLPKGMYEIKQENRKLAGTGQRVEHKLFSDGLIDVSVYVQPAGDSFNKDIATTNGLNTFLSRTIQGMQVTVIGEIPPDTANAIASSLSRN